MSEARFFLDENMARHALARSLRSYSIDVETAIEVGLRTADDDQLIPHVLASGRVLVTGDHRLVHRMADLTRQGGHHPGVLIVPGKHRDKIGDLVFSLRLIHEIHSAEEMVDRIDFIPY